MLAVKNKLDIVYVPRKQIVFWKGNPRKNNRAAVALAELIRANGLKSPLILWAKNNVVYKGNTTLKALDIINGDKPYTVPVIFHDFKDEAAANAYGLSDNKASEYAEWDEDILAQMLESKAMKPLLESTGFKSKEIANLLWLPDTGKAGTVVDTDQGMAAKVQIFCSAEDREDIVQLLQDWAENSGFEGVIVK